MKQSVFHLPGMDCPAEEQLIRGRLERMAEVESLGFNLLDRELTVRHSLPDDGPLLAALREVGMEASVQLPLEGVRRDRILISGMC